MNYKTAMISAFCLFSLAFVIACGAQNDSLNTDEILIQKLMNDPLTEQFNVNHNEQTNLIMFNDLDMEALGDILKISPGNDACNVTADVSQITHAREYFDNMCQHIRLMTSIKEKYPDLENLDRDIRIMIFYHSEPITFEDVIKMSDARYKID